MYLLHRGMYIAFKRMLYTGIVILLYTAIYNLKFPGIAPISSVEKSAISVLGQSTRPYVLANIVMGMLSLIFDYVDKLKNSKDTRSTYDILNICAMMFFSVTHSAISICLFEPHVISEFKSDFFLYYSVINLTGTLFVAWFNRQMILNGIGQGVSIIVSLQILHSFIIKRKIVGFFDVFTNIGIRELMFIYCMFTVLIAIEKFVVRIPLMALTTYGYGYKENVTKGYIEYKSTTTNVLSNILALQTISLFSMIMSWSSKLDFTSILNSFTLSSACNTFLFSLNNSGSYTNMSKNFLHYIFYILLLFSYNYIYSNVYHSSTKTADAMRRQICYIPYVSIGKRTDNLIDNIAMVSSFIAVGVTIIITVLPLPLSYYFGYEDILGGISMLIISSSFMHLIDFTKSIYSYNTYVFNSDSLIVKNKI